MTLPSLFPTSIVYGDSDKGRKLQTSPQLVIILSNVMVSNALF
jgi:hypothetical protein